MVFSGRLSLVFPILKSSGFASPLIFLLCNPYLAPAGISVVCFMYVKQQSRESNLGCQAALRLLVNASL